ncbi:MAG: hypothetical protein P4L87_03145, partial [Formivibrio sp.]|nr:hypothetical protein [Formivibrio sp.]
ASVHSRRRPTSSAGKIVNGEMTVAHDIRHGLTRIYKISPDGPGRRDTPHLVGALPDRSWDQADDPGEYGDEKDARASAALKVSHSSAASRLLPIKSETT